MSKLLIGRDGRGSWRPHPSKLMCARDRREDCHEARLHDARGSTGPEEPTLISEDDFDVGSSHRVRAATERVLMIVADSQLRSDRRPERSYERINGPASAPFELHFMSAPCDRC